MAYPIQEMAIQTETLKKIRAQRLARREKQYVFRLDAQQVHRARELDLPDSALIAIEAGRAAMGKDGCSGGGAAIGAGGSAGRPRPAAAGVAGAGGGASLCVCETPSKASNLSDAACGSRVFFVAGVSG